MWFVSEFAKAGHLPALGRAARLAPRNVSERFATEEIFDAARGEPPVGVYHLMRTVPHANRSKLLDLCPEAKLLFPANHDPRCKAACPRDRTMLDQPLRVWTERREAAPRFFARFFSPGSAARNPSHVVGARRPRPTRTGAPASSFPAGPNLLKIYLNRGCPVCSLQSS